MDQACQGCLVLRLKMAEKGRCTFEKQVDTVHVQGAALATREKVLLGRVTLYICDSHDNQMFLRTHPRNLERLEILLSRFSHRCHLRLDARDAHSGCYVDELDLTGGSTSVVLTV